MTITYAMTSTVLVIGLAIMLVDAMSKLRGSSHRRVSIVLTATAMVYVALDCIWIVLYTADAFDARLFTAVNFLFYLVYITLPFVWFQFAQHFAYDLSGKGRAKAALAIPWAVNLVLVLVSVAGSDVLWSIGDALDRYTRGPLFGVFSNLNLVYYFIPVVEILVLLALRRGADRRTLLATLGFSVIPALGVLVYTYFISVDAIYPFQPCCFFIGVMFAYILLVTQIYDEALSDNLLLAERARASEKIAELTESMGSLLTNMPALTFSKDVETGKYMACNQLFAEYACRPTPNDVVGLTDFEIFDEETAEHFVSDDKTALSMDEPYVFFEDVPDASGEQHQFQTTKLKFTDAHGRLCTLGMCVDVTETMTVKREADRARMEKEVADAQNRAKSTFLSNMSHDIRTPMNAVIGFTDIALKDLSDPDRTREYLGKIKSSSEHLLSLINDILEMSRIESGKLDLEEVPCRLPDILHDLNAIIVGQVESRQHELAMDAMGVVDEDVCCDKLRLNRVLLNILSNAVKYTPPGGKISLRLSQLDGAPEGYGTYEFRVKDNGIGMTPEFAERIFDAFERERNSTVSGIQGTGLGMAITKRIVDLMGGTISVQTALGEGSEFVVRLTLKLQDAPRRDRSIPCLEGIHALVVDDDFDTCDSATRMLSEMGMRPEWTTSGRESVLRARQAKELSDSFGVFVIDLKMPDMSGIEAARQIRAAVGDESPILMITAYDWPAVKDEALAAGVDAFCSKPLFLSELHDALLKVIEGESPEQDRPEGPEDVDFGGRRVLVVEDMMANRVIASMMLSSHNLQIEEAVDGQQALDMVRDAEPGYYDAVLMDIQMPVMDGYEATRSIRALDPAHAGVPIVAMTANAFEEDRRKALECGMDGHVAKPIDEGRLVGMLAEIWGL